MDEKKSPKVPDGKTVVDLGVDLKRAVADFVGRTKGLTISEFFRQVAAEKVGVEYTPSRGPDAPKKDKVPIALPAGDKERLKTEAKAAGLSLNAYLLRKLGIRPEGAEAKPAEVSVEEDAPPPEE